MEISRESSSQKDDGLEKKGEVGAQVNGRIMMTEIRA